MEELMSSQEEEDDDHAHGLEKDEEKGNGTFCVADPHEYATDDFKFWLYLHGYTLGALYLLLAVFVTVMILRLLFFLRIRRPFMIAIHLLLLAFTIFRTIFLFNQGHANGLVYQIVGDLGIPAKTSAYALIMWVMHEITQLRMSNARLQSKGILVAIITFHFIFIVVVDIIVGKSGGNCWLLLTCQIFNIAWAIFLTVVFFLVTRRIYLVSRELEPNFRPRTYSKPMLDMMATATGVVAVVGKDVPLGLGGTDSPEIQEERLYQLKMQHQMYPCLVGDAKLPCDMIPDNTGDIEVDDDVFKSGEYSKTVFDSRDGSILFHRLDSASEQKASPNTRNESTPDSAGASEHVSDANDNNEELCQAEVNLCPERESRLGMGEGVENAAFSANEQPVRTGRKRMDYERRILPDIVTCSLDIDCTSEDDVDERKSQHIVNDIDSSTSEEVTGREDTAAIDSPVPVRGVSGNTSPSDCAEKPPVAPRRPKPLVQPTPMIPSERRICAESKSPKPERGTFRVLLNSCESITGVEEELFSAAEELPIGTTPYRIVCEKSVPSNVVTTAERDTRGVDQNVEEPNNQQTLQWNLDRNCNEISDVAPILDDTYISETRPSITPRLKKPPKPRTRSPHPRECTESKQPVPVTRRPRIAPRTPKLGTDETVLDFDGPLQQQGRLAIIQAPNANNNNDSDNQVTLQPLSDRGQFETSGKRLSRKAPRTRDRLQSTRRENPTRKLQIFGFFAVVLGTIGFMLSVIGTAYIYNPIRIRSITGSYAIMWLVFITFQRLLEFLFALLLAFLAWQRSDNRTT